MGGVREEHAKEGEGTARVAGDRAGRGRSVDSSGPSMLLWAPGHVRWPPWALGMLTGEMRESASHLAQTDWSPDWFPPPVVRPS